MLTIIFVILDVVALVVAIIGLRKPELILAFEQKCQTKIFKKKLNSNNLTSSKIRRMAFGLMLVTIFISVAYISIPVCSGMLR